MGLKYKNSESVEHSGYGAGSGSIDTTVYECPCGKGEVIHTKDNIPGFRDSDILIYCEICREKYKNATKLGDFEE